MKNKEKNVLQPHILTKYHEIDVTSKLNSTDRKEESHPEILKSDSLNVPKFFLRLSLRAVNSLAISIRQRLSVLCL